MSEARSVIVIGAGFIGSAVALKLRAAGWHVAVVSRGDASHLAAAGCETFRVDQAEIEALLPMLSGYAAFVHAACSTTPAASRDDASVEDRQHLDPLARCLESLHKRAPLRLVHLSSGGTLYGNPAILPAPEELPLQPISNHGRAKVRAERLMADFAHSSGSALTILRPSNVFGPGQVPRPGFGVIRTMLDCALARRPFRYWGGGLRDYLFIEDMATAVVSVLETSEATGVFNVGSGIGTTLDGLVHEVGLVTGRSLEIESLEAPDGDVSNIVLDPTRLRMATGWHPEVSLRAGIERTWTWLRRLKV